MVWLCGPAKRIARFWARSGSILAPAMAFWACWRCSSAGPERVINAAANSICGSEPRRPIAFFTTTEVPIVTDPRQRLCRSNFDAMADERRACLGKGCQAQQGCQEYDDESR